jgi:5-(carboxyamino)imidazole ribonucleotide synthase
VVRVTETDLTDDPTLPGPTLGVVGGGQLGRMLAEAAAPLGVDVVALDPTPDPPAGRVAEAVRAAFDDAGALRDLAARADLLTFEIELADPDRLDAVREATGTPVHPDPDALRVTGDKLVETRTLADAGVPVPPFARVDDVDDLREAVERFDRVMLKARTGGYDGRGNAPVGGPDDPDPAAAIRAVGGDVGDAGAVAQSFVDYDRELAVMAVRGADGTTTYPATETVHREEILRETVVPARTDAATRERAAAVARDVLDVLPGRGAFGVELFDAGGEVLVNEVAPRPHNSGHWTIEGAVTSQFEQHVRAVCGWPLGATDARGATATANVLADVDEPTPARLRGAGTVLAAVDAHLHWYGKRDARPLRKMGHLTVRDDDGVRGDAGDDGDGDGDGDPLARARRLRDGLTFTSGGGEAADDE